MLHQLITSQLCKTYNNCMVVMCIYVYIYIYIYIYNNNNFIYNCCVLWLCMYRDIHTTTLYYWPHTTGMPHLKIQSLVVRWKHFRSSSSAIFVDDIVPQLVLYCVCVCVDTKNDGTMGLGNSWAPALQPGSGTFGLSSLPQHEKKLTKSSLRCKHGCVVRIPPSINRVLRNGFPS